MGMLLIDVVVVSIFKTYVALCCLMLRYVVSCCATLSHVVLRCLMLCYVVSCCATLSHVALCCLMFLCCASGKFYTGRPRPEVDI